MTNEKTTKRKRRFWLIPAGIVLVFALFALYIVAADAPGRREIAEMELGAVDFSNLADGTYVGSYTGERSHMRDVTLEVTIENGAVTSVQIVQGAQDAKGNPAELGDGVNAADWIDRAIAAQSLQIDAVSGATLTGKTLLKALENALRQAH